MITMKDFGRNGRLGNQLFQYASLMGLADKCGKELRLPLWRYSRFFKGLFPFQVTLPSGCSPLQEPGFHYTDLIGSDFAGPVNVVKSYLQSEKYWWDIEGSVREALKFTKEFTIDCLSLMTKAFEKETVAIHIRRGDYVDNDNYVNLPITYYLTALQNISGWRNMNIVVFSDDIEYAKIHFGCLDNVFFSEGNSDIEDLCLMSQCDHFIVANSTFSWWGAYLGEKDNSKIIRPDRYFSGSLAERCDDKDFWPAHWTAWYADAKIDLRDVTFTIPVKYDSPDRKHNLDIIINYLKKFFDTKIIVGEQGRHVFYYVVTEGCEYIHWTKMTKFHRTQMLNGMAYTSQTPIIANWDADVLVAPLQLWKAVEMIRNGADMVFPYDGCFARAPRIPWVKPLMKNHDVGIFAGAKLVGTFDGDNKKSVGGAVLFNKFSFFAGGGENENFISFGPEDCERNHRFSTLEFDVQRVKGSLYHINHRITIDSSKHNPNMANNKAENKKVGAMNKQELIDYISTWPWIKK